MTNQQITERTARIEREKEENAWRDEKLIKAIFGDNIPESDCSNCPGWYDESRGYSCQGDVNACMYN